MRIVNIRRIEERKVRKLLVFYDPSYKKFAKEGISYFLNEIAEGSWIFKRYPKISVEFRRSPLHYSYGTLINIHYLFDELVIKHKLNSSEIRVTYFTGIYPVGI